MKSRKIVALVLCASMMMGVVAGCSKVKKVSLKSMNKAANKVDAVVIDDLDAEELMEDGPDIDDDDFEDGVYIEINNDTMSDLLDELPKDAQKQLDMYLDFLDIDMDIDDIQEAGMYLRREDDTNIAIVVYVDLGNDEVCGELFNTAIDYSEDLNDLIEDAIEELELDDSEYFEDYEFNLDNMDKKNYYFNGSDKGYIKMCITEDVIEEFLEEDIPAILDGTDADFDEDDIEDMVDEVLDDMPFDVLGGGLYFNGSSVVFTMIMSDDDDFIADYETFMKTIGLDSPTKAPLSADSRKVLLPALLGNVASYVNKAKRAAYDVDYHNAEIESVIADIDANYDY